MDNYIGFWRKLKSNIFRGNRVVAILNTIISILIIEEVKEEFEEEIIIIIDLNK